MKKIKLTRGKYAIVDDKDFEELNQYKWYYHNMGYASRGGGRVLMHKEIFKTDREIDHADGNGLNNQRENLRECEHCQNIYNSKIQKNSKSGIKGVRWLPDRNKSWQAYICPNNAFKSLGYFETKEKAAIAYNQAANKYYGEFARKNKI